MVRQWWSTGACEGSLSSWCSIGRTTGRITQEIGHGRLLQERDNPTNQYWTARNENLRKRQESVGRTTPRDSWS